VNALTDFKTRQLTVEEVKPFQDNVLALAGEAKARQRETNKALWLGSAGFFLFGCIGLAVGAAHFIWAINQPPQVIVVTVNATTGELKVGVGPKDAPKTFPEIVNEHAIKDYVELWENYTWQADPVNYQKVLEMSSDEQRDRYIAWHNDPLSPVKKLGRHGYVQVDHSTLQVFPVGTGKDNTLIYNVQFDRIEVTNGAAGRTEHYTGEIQFQWHPDWMTTDPQRSDNPGGFTTIAYYRKPPA